MANILIADPNPGIRELISESLQDSGHRLLFAEDSTKVQEALQKNLIHLLLADEDLPGQEPMEFVKEIKKQYPQTAVILMTGMGEDESEELLDAGASAVLSKPFNLADFKRIVTEAIPHSLETLTAIRPDQKEKDKTAPVSPQKIFWTIFSIGLLALGGGGAYWYFKVWSQPIRIYSLPYSHISAMAHAQGFLWTSDWFAQTFYQHNLDAILSVKQSFPLALGGKGGRNGSPRIDSGVSAANEYVPTSITWDGKNFWSVSSWTKKIVRHGGELHKLELELESPVKEPTAIFFDGEFFWFCDASEGLIVRCILEGKKLKAIESAPSPAQKPAGIYKDRKNLWTFDARSELFYKHLPEKNFKVIAVYALPEQFQKEKISCFTSDGKNFWVGSESSQKIYQIPPRHLKLVSQSD